MKQTTLAHELLTDNDIDEYLQMITDNNDNMKTLNNKFTQYIRILPDRDIPALKTHMLN